VLEKLGTFVFDLFMFVTPGLLGFFVSRDTRLNRAAGKRETRFAAYSTPLFFLNITICYVCYFIALFVNGPMSDSSWADYRWMQVEHVISIVGTLTALLTLVFNSSSELLLASKLKMWGSALALVLWPLIYLISSEMLSAISRHLAHS
jgi:hypothetical protein